MHETLNTLKSLLPQCVVDNENGESVLDVQALTRLVPCVNTQDFAFSWQGKQRAYAQAQSKSNLHFTADVTRSVDFSHALHLYIEGDNLDALKLLKESYESAIKMIYIDPPYNTGRDFVYSDDFRQSKRQKVSTQARLHNKWLNMMLPRLVLARELLKDEGVIFVSIDSHEVHHLRLLMDEIFGEENFVADLIWQRAYSPKNDTRYVSNSHDYILLYAKDKTRFKAGRVQRELKTAHLYKNLDNDPRGPWISTDLTAKTYSVKGDFAIVSPSGKPIYPTTGRSWAISRETFDSLMADNLIYFGKNGSGMPRRKRFLSEKKDEAVPTTLLLREDVGDSQSAVQELKELLGGSYFNGPKPVALISHLLEIANIKDNDIVLDFFSGSATTAQAVMSMNEQKGTHVKSIMVQLDEEVCPASLAAQKGFHTICDIAQQRMRAFITKSHQNSAGGGG